jgi:phosphate/sulfate permease
MSEQAKSKLQDMMGSIIASLIVSIVGGGASMYIGYRLLEQRVMAVEHDQKTLADMVDRHKTEADAARERMSDRLAEIQRDVSFIRGTLEKR